MFIFQAEKAAFDEAEKKREEEVLFHYVLPYLIEVNFIVWSFTYEEI